MTYDAYGLRRFEPEIDRLVADQIRGMTSPVRCTCGQVYDLGKVEVKARYTDCSIWNAPCCGRQADDRGETGWKTTQDYYRIDRNGREVRR